MERVWWLQMSSFPLDEANIALQNPSAGTEGPLEAGKCQGKEKNEKHWKERGRTGCKRTSLPQINVWLQACGHCTLAGGVASSFRRHNSRRVSLYVSSLSYRPGANTRWHGQVPVQADHHRHQLNVTIRRPGHGEGHGQGSGRQYRVLTCTSRARPIQLLVTQARIPPFHTGHWVSVQTRFTSVRERRIASSACYTAAVDARWLGTHTSGATCTVWATYTVDASTQPVCPVFSST